MRTNDVPDESSLISALTLTLWVGCVVIGALGHFLPYNRPILSAPAAPPIEAEILQVELTTDPLLPPDAPSLPPGMIRPPPLHEQINLPSAPPMIAVAETVPAVAFALPTEGATRIVSAAEAIPHRVAVQETPRPAVPTVQSLTYGYGEGKQPAPIYPSRAVREGQEGVVTVRFNVGDHGRVIAAEACNPSPWPLLNEAAVRVIRERWRFRPGTSRFYQVAIRFELNQ